MSKTIRLLALVLAVLMLVPAALSGCSTGDDPAVTTTATPSLSGSDATDPATEPSGDAVGETTADPNKIDLDGYEFVLNTQGYGGGLNSILGEGESVTAEFDEVQQIYAQIEADLNCVITATGSDNKTDTLLPAAVGGVFLQDFISCRQSTWIPLAMMGGIRPLETMIDAGLDLYNENNFNQIYTLMSTIEGHVYALDVTGKYDNVALGHFYAFNKELCEGAGYPAETLFQAVRDGEWDYDMMLEVARKISKDTDGDGVNDIWGVALDCDGNEAWTNGTGPIVFDEAQDKWISNVMDPQLIPALQFMSDISQNDVQTPVAGGIGRGDRRTLFYQGKCGFAGLYGGNFGDENLGSMEAEFGLLPMPKGPDAENYTMNMVDLDTFVCQSANQDWEKSAKIINAIGAAVTDFDAYRERILADCFGDEESVEMIFDYALPNATMNIAKCSDEMNNIMRKGLYQSIYQLDMTPAQAAEAYNDKIQAELDAVFQQ